MKEPKLEAICIVMALALLVLIAIRPGEAHAQLNQQLIDMPDNTWLKLDPQPSQRYIPTGSTPSNTLETTTNPQFRSFSGSTYGDGKIYFMGGGHGSYPGNDVEIYDIAQNIWTQQFKPEVCTTSDCDGLYGGASVTVISPMGRPYTLHTYQLQTYDPLRKQFIAAYNSGLFAFDLPTDPTDKNDFIRLHPWPWVGGNKWPVPNNVINTKLLVYDPTLGRVVFFDRKSNEVHSFNYGSGNWEFIGSGASGSGGDVHSAYDPIRKKHLVVLKGESVQWWDAATNTWEKMSSPPSYVLTAHNLAYDTANNVILIAGNGTSGQTIDTLWIYDAQDQWTQITANGTPPSGGNTSRWGTLSYDPAHNAFILVDQNSNNKPVDTWAYRYKKQPLSSDTTPPATPTGLTVQ